MKGTGQGVNKSGKKGVKAVTRYREEEKKSAPEKGDYFVFKAFAVLLLVIVAISYITKLGGRATDRLESGFMSTFNPGMNDPRELQPNEPYTGNPNYR